MASVLVVATPTTAAAAADDDDDVATESLVVIFGQSFEDMTRKFFSMPRKNVLVLS